MVVDGLTLSSTRPKLESSISVFNFSYISSVRERLSWAVSWEEEVEVVVGPERTVGLWMSSIRRPIAVVMISLERANDRIYEFNK